MRKLYVIILFIGLIYSYTLSQEKIESPYIPKKSYWSSSIDAGVLLPSGQFSNSYGTSYSIGLDLAYNPFPMLSINVNTAYNFLSTKNDTSKGSTPAIIEVGAEGRLYTVYKRLNFFAEAGFGDYIYRYTLYNGVLGAPSTYSGNFGLNGGAGVDFAFARMLTVFLKADFHSFFNTGNKNNFGGIYLGVRNIF